MTYLEWWIQQLKEFPHQNQSRAQQISLILLEAILVTTLIIALHDVIVNSTVGGFVVFAVILGIVYLSIYQEEKE